MIELLKKYWPRTIWGFFALQLRIGLSLAILVPLFLQLDSLTPGIGLLLLVCIAPALALIFIVNRQTLLWASFLLLFTALGGLVGLVIANAAGSPYLKYISSRSPQPDRIDHIFCASIVATAFWWLAIKTRRRYHGSVANPAELPDVIIEIADRRSDLDE